MRLSPFSYAYGGNSVFCSDSDSHLEKYYLWQNNCLEKIMGSQN